MFGGSIALLILIGWGIWFLLFRRNKDNDQNDEDASRIVASLNNHIKG